MAIPPPSPSTAGLPTLCVVEGDEHERQALLGLFGKLAVQVESFSSGESLLESLHEHGIHALVTELELPGMSGLDLLQELTARGHRIPAILLTEGSDVATAVGAMRAGAVDFIEKPVIDRILLRRVEDALSGAAGVAS
jgi:two-component system CheB/CheR fusion protein